MSLARLQKRRRHGSHGDGYWPAYVDALINVVLNLMFLVAMLAVGSFVLGMEIARKILLQPLQAPVRNVTRILDDAPPEQGRGRSFITIDVVGSTEQGGSKMVRIDRVRSIQNQSLLHVKFTRDALQLSDSIRIDLIPRLREILLLNPGASFSVWAVSEADPQAQRVSFLRVMALREALNRVGIENSRIVTRILPGTNTAVDGQLVYVLVRSNQNRKEANEQ
jgi:hypothetical protein